MAANTPVPSTLWLNRDVDPPRLLDVLTHIAHGLHQLGYTKTFGVLCKEASKNKLTIDIAEWERGFRGGSTVPLLGLYDQWHTSRDTFPSMAAQTRGIGNNPDSDSESDSESEDSDNDGESERDVAEEALVDIEAEETSDDESDEEIAERDSDAESSDSSDSSSTGSTKPGTKRKRVLTPSSSSEDSSSDSDSSSESSSSDESDARPTKRAKVASSSPRSSSSSSSNSDSNSDSDSSSESDSDSASAESESTDSDSSSPAPRTSTAKAKAKAKHSKKLKSAQSGNSSKTRLADAKQKDNGSQSSETLDADSTAEKDEVVDGPGDIHPDRLKRMPATKKEVAAEAKKQNVPFSRIPTNQTVDPRFASNEYVSYDYADRAYRDLSVTKGKGFTKEKNKKKRGAYRGGAIDFTPKGIKFDD